MVYGVIMAGGKGTRLWPEGWQSKPKQLLSLVEGRTMIRIAVERLAPLIPPERQIIVTTTEYAEMTAEALPSFPRENILAEPQGKNTAPCIGWAAVKIRKKDPDAVMAVVTADHAISDENLFRQTLSAAIETAQQQDIVTTVGLRPTRPETGFGYLRYSDLLGNENGLDIFRVAEFVEKPDLDRAKQYLENGQYLWNSGMFIMRVSFALELFRRHLPRHHSLLMQIADSAGTEDEERITEKCYAEFASISIDYGIMEHAAEVAVVPGQFDWADVGTWTALDFIREHDKDGNIVDGQHIGIDTNDCIIRSQHGLVATLGVHDLVIVNTPEALLVCTKDKAQEVKALVNHLEEIGRIDRL